MGRMSRDYLEEVRKLLRSINWYASKDVQYDEEKFKKWSATNQDEIKKLGDLTEDKKIKFEDLGELITLYFVFCKDNAVALTTNCKRFLNNFTKMNMFEDCNKLMDLQEELCLEKELLENSTMPNTPRLNDMKVSNKITIEKLSGDEADLSEWFEDFQRLSIADGWTETVIGNRLPSYLSGSALMIWKNMDTGTSNFKKIKEEILSRLGSEKNYLTEFCTRVQQEGEKVADFSVHVEFLAKRSKLASDAIEKQVLRKFWDGLLPEIKKLVVSQDPQHIKEAVIIAKKVEVVLEAEKNLSQIQTVIKSPLMDRPSRSSIRNNNFERRKSRSNSEGGSNEFRSNRRSPTPKYPGRPIICFRCNKTGHMAYNCRGYNSMRDTRKCYRCGRIGHLEYNCRAQLSKNI